MRNNIILDKSFASSVKVVNLYKHLFTEKKEFVLSKQLLQSGTSFGAYAEEAVCGYSKKDFSAKLGISYKDARETHYWLRLMYATGYISENEFNSMIKDCNELLKILYSIIKSSNK